MFYAIPDTLLKVSLNTNKTGPMFYVIPDTLLKVAFNTNKTDNHFIRYTWHIVESVVKHQ